MKRRIEAMDNYSVGEYIIYRNGDRYELGRIKSLQEDGAFVAYHEGETGAKTPWDCMHKLTNAHCIKDTTLGGECFKQVSTIEPKTKVIAQVTFDEEKLREIVKGAVERFKEEYEIESKRGEWVIVKEPIEKYGEVLFDCSACGLHFYRTEHRQGAKIGWNFCPNCGADMRGKDDE